MTWKAQKIPVDNGLNNISITSSGIIAAVGNDGIIFSALPPPGDGTAVSGIVTDRIDLRVYPNPFSQETTIYFEVDNSEHVSLSVYTVTGELVNTLIDKDLMPGAYEFQWDARRYSESIYVIKLQIGSCTISKKMVLIRNQD